MNDEEYVISFEFRLCYSNGKEIDSNIGKEPMVFRTGANEMLPALEAELIQMEVGEQKQVFLTAEEAYGPVNENKFRRFPLNAIPEEARKVGRKVMAQAPDGSEEMVDVVDIVDDQVVLDFNHKLAGKDLQFDVKVIAKS